jgi:hypothetical protein
MDREGASAMNEPMIAPVLAPSLILKDERFAWLDVSRRPTSDGIYAVLLDCSPFQKPLKRVRCLAWWHEPHGWQTSLGYPATVTHWMALPEVPA